MRRRAVKTRVEVEVKPHGATGGERVRGELLENWGFSGKKMGSRGSVFEGCQMRNAFLVGVRGVTHWLVNRDCPVKSE